MGLDEIVNGGRAEPKTEAMSSESVLAAQSTPLKSINAEEWTCRDLNSGPLPCQGSDLPTDLHAHVGAFATRRPAPP